MLREREERGERVRERERVKMLVTLVA